MENTMNKQTYSLKRISFIIGMIGALTLVLGFFLAGRENLQELGKTLSIAGEIILGIGVAGLIIAWRDNLRGFSRSRQARYGSMSVVLTLSFIGIVIMLNYLVYRHDQRLDLTASKSFTLAEQTQKILKDLDQKVKVTAFLRAGDASRQEALNRLEAYRTIRPDTFSFEIIDPDRQPAITLGYGNVSPGSLIVEAGESRKEIFAPEEQQLTSAILAITRKNKPKIYFLTGHNEQSPENHDIRVGLSDMKTALEAENYQVATLALPAEKMAVPEDARAVVIAGPETALTQEERKAIQNYVDKENGSLLLLVQPRYQTGLEGWLNTYGVQIGNNIVVDPGRNIQNDVTFPAFNEYPFHPITKDLERKFVSLPMARTVKIYEAPKKVQATELLLTTPVSWAETNLTENSLIQKDPGDPTGPLSVAVALSLSPETELNPNDEVNKEPKTPKQSRIVVVGNSMFANNYFARFLGNGDFFLNTIAWIATEDDLISIRSTPKEDRQLQLTNQQEKWVFNFSIFGMPLILLLIAGIIWWKRR